MFPNKGEKNESETTLYTSLKDDFLNDRITAESLRDRLIAFDQQTPEREASDKNLKFLSDADIVHHIKEKHSEFFEAFNHFLSLTEFHVAQRLALDGNETGAITHFENSLNAAYTGKSPDEWIAYIKGTLFYLKKDVIPDWIIEQAGSGINGDILRKMSDSLKKEEYLSYRNIYNK